jgi:hypothetical protein
MNYLTFVIARAIVRVTARIVAAFIHAIKGDPARTLCVHCAHAHITLGHLPGQRKTACTYGGVSRAMKFVVTDCTMFCNRNANAPIVRITGFAQCLDNPQQPAIAARLHD